MIPFWPVASYTSHPISSPILHGGAHLHSGAPPRPNHQEHLSFANLWLMPTLPHSPPTQRVLWVKPTSLWPCSLKSVGSYVFVYRLHHKTTSWLLVCTLWCASQPRPCPFWGHFGTFLRHLTYNSPENKIRQAQCCLLTRIGPAYFISTPNPPVARKRLLQNPPTNNYLAPCTATGALVGLPPACGRPLAAITRARGRP